MGENYAKPTHQFTVANPSLERRRQRMMLSPGYLSKAQGVDGRFSGSIRRFPGFKKLHTAQASGPTAFTSVEHFQAFSIQKGNTSEYIRGFFVYGNAGGYKTVLNYYDQNSSTWNIFAIESVSAGETVSVAENGKVLYYFRDGGTAKSIFWTGDAATGQLNIEDMGPGDFGSGADDLVPPTVVLYDDGGGTPVNYVGVLDAGKYLVAYRLRDTDRNVYSGVSPVTEFTTTSDDLSLKVSGSFVTASSNIDDFDTVEIYRTISATFAGNAYDGGILYKCGEADLEVSGANTVFEYIIGLDSTDSGAPSPLPDFFDELRDEQVVQQFYVDPVYEFAAPPPDTGIAEVYQGVTFAGGTSSGTNADQKARIQYSSLRSTNPENFPPSNAVNLDSVTGELLAFIKSGDVLFGFSRNSILRIQRAGTQLDFRRLADGRSVVSRYALASVDNKVFFITPSQALYLDPAAGSLTNIGAVDRIILDDWKESLASVSCCYDASIGATVALNPTENEAFLIWATTNTVTTLGDLPFVLCDDGVTPSIGNLASFFITDDGRIYYPNATGDATGISLTTLGLSGDVRGACTATGTTVTLTTGATNSDALGSFIYLKNSTTALDEDKYERKQITAVPNGTQYTVDSTVTAGATAFELSPVAMSVRFWPIRTRPSRNAAQVYPRPGFDRIKTDSYKLYADENTLPADEVLVGYYLDFANTMGISSVLTLQANQTESVKRLPAEGQFVEPGLDIYVSGGIIEIVTILVIEVETKSTKTGS